MPALEAEQHRRADAIPASHSPATALVGVASDFGRNTLAYILKSRHYKVLPARTLDALISLLAANPDLVIVDDTLSPDRPLSAVVKEIRAAASAGTAILLLADVVAREDLVNLVRSGTNYVMLKNGFDVERFFDVAAKQVQPASRQRPRSDTSGTTAASSESGPRRAAAPTVGGGVSAAAHAKPAAHDGAAASVRPVPVAAAPSAAEQAAACQPDANPGSRAQATALQMKWERALSFRDKIVALLERVSQVKALPTIVSEVLALTGSGYSECRELVDTLRQDVALTSRVLGLANSSLYRRQRSRVTSLDTAVKAIGFKSIREIALGVSIFNLFDISQNGLVNARRFWRHSFATASIARQLAEHCGLDNGEELYLTGLLHDIGVLILDEFLSESLAALAARMREEAQIGPAFERACLSTDHARLGYEVMTRWKVPSVLTEPIRDHHSPSLVIVEDKSNKGHNTAILQAADMLAVAFGFENGMMDYLTRMPPHVMKHLKLDQLDMAAVRDTVSGQVDEMQVVMGLYEARSKVSARSQAPPTTRTVYVAPGRPPIDLISTWCQSQGLNLHEVEDPEACKDLAAGPVLINLWGRAPSEPMAKACLAVPATRCLVLGSAQWRRLLEGRLPAGWAHVSDWVASVQLRRFLALPDAAK